MERMSPEVAASCDRVLSVEFDSMPQFSDWEPLSNLPGPFEAIICMKPPSGPLDWLLPRGLTSLTLLFHDPPPPPAELVLFVLSANPALRELHIQPIADGFTDEMWAVIAEGLATNTTLESFRLDYLLDQGGVDRFADVLLRNAKLQALHFELGYEEDDEDMGAFSNVDWHDFADALRRNTSLRSLTIVSGHAPWGNPFDQDIFVAATRHNTAVTVNLLCECYDQGHGQCALASCTHIKNGIACRR